MADQRDADVLDICVYVDLNLLEAARAELHQGVVVAKDPALRASRTEKLGAAITDFSPLPFDGDAARYGTFVAMVLAIGRDPRKTSAASKASSKSSRSEHDEGAALSRESAAPSRLTT